jgi:two-component system KDP operon response regulator KdpE
MPVNPKHPSIDGKRCYANVAHLPTAPDLAVIAVGPLRLDLEAQLVLKDGEPVHLTPTEFSLLREFVQNPGKLLTHAMLLRRVWGPGYQTETEYTRVYVRRIRAKLESPDGPELIRTEPRAGYRFIAR